MRWLFILLVILPPSCVAQTRPTRKGTPSKAAAAPAAAWPVESIAIEGNREYTRDQILTAAQLKVGQMAAPKDFDAARMRLDAAGVFDKMALRFGPATGGKGYAVTIQVREAGPFFPVRFEGLSVPAEELTKAVQKTDPFFGARIAATQESMARYARVVEGYLAAQSHQEKVVGRMLPNDAGLMEVVFGPVVALPAVSRIRFINNQVLAASFLENTMSAVAVGAPYQEARFQHLLDLNIRPLYEARGRVRVTFPEVKVEQDKSVKGVVVTVKVLEGPIYTLGDVSVEGSALPSAQLLKLADLRRGGEFNIQQVQAGAAKMERRAKREGFMKVKTRIDRQIDDKAKVVGVTIHVEDGPRYVFAKLDIQGLDTLSEPAIRKMWTIKAGQPFNAEYPDYFLSQVRDEGMLDNLGETKAVVKPDDDARTVDVTLIFRGEAKPAPKKEPGAPGS